MTATSSNPDRSDPAERAGRTGRAGRPVRGPVLRGLEGCPVTAAWGDPALLRPFLPGLVPGGAPVAEVWYGAHPRNPSWVHDAQGRRPVTELPELERPRPLMKLLAAAGPLSIQVHPDEATARRGFDEEERLGVAPDAPERRFVDASGKPELVRALGPMRVLCGLRAASQSRRLLSMLVPTGADVLLEALAHGDAGLGEAVALLLSADRVTAGVLLAAVADGARDVLARDLELDAPSRGDAAALVRLAELALDLQQRFPDDPGTLVALLLEDTDLAPGDAIFVAPGTPHAYLSGLGVEVMAPSDNVLRGGMTVKQVDVDAFLEVLDAGAVGVPRVGTLPRTSDGPGWRRTIVPTDAFVLDEAEVDGALAVERTGSGAGMLLCADGQVVVRAGEEELVLRPGGAALVGSGTGPVVVRGSGLVLHASVPRSSVGPAVAPVRDQPATS